MDVLAHAEATDSSDFWRNLFAGEVTAHTGLSTLANLDFDSISLHQVFFGYAIFIRDVLKNKFFRSGLLLGHDTALTAFFHTAGHGGSLGQGDFRFAGQSTKGHMRYEDRIFRYQRPFSVLAQYYGRAHLFLVQQRRRIQLSAQNQNIVPVRHLHLGTHSTTNGLAGDSHFMNLGHIAIRSIMTSELRIIS